MGTAEPVAMMGIFTCPATGSMAANPVEGVDPSTASTVGSSAAFLRPAIACSRELAMSHTLSLMVYVLPQVSVKPPASLRCLAASSTPWIDRVPYEPACPVRAFIWKKWTTRSSASDVLVKPPTNTTITSPTPKPMSNRCMFMSPSFPKNHGAPYPRCAFRQSCASASPADSRAQHAVPLRLLAAYLCNRHLWQLEHQTQ